MNPAGTVRQRMGGGSHVNNDVKHTALVLQRREQEFQRLTKAKAILKDFLGFPDVKSAEKRLLSVKLTSTFIQPYEDANSLKLRFTKQVVKKMEGTYFPILAFTINGKPLGDEALTEAKQREGDSILKIDVRVHSNLCAFVKEIEANPDTKAVYKRPILFPPLGSRFEFGATSQSQSSSQTAGLSAGEKLSLSDLTDTHYVDLVERLLDKFSSDRLTLEANNRFTETAQFLGLKFRVDLSRLGADDTYSIVMKTLETSDAINNLDSIRGDLKLNLNNLRPDQRQAVNKSIAIMKVALRLREQKEDDYFARFAFERVDRKRF